MSSCGPRAVTRISALLKEVSPYAVIDTDCHMITRITHSCTHACVDTKYRIAKHGDTVKLPCRRGNKIPRHLLMLDNHGVR
jgi:hypothetical protein